MTSDTQHNCAPQEHPSALPVKCCRKCAAPYVGRTCGACKAITNAAWELRNKEKLREKKAAFRAANREKLKAYAAEYRALNPDKVKAGVSAWAKSEKGKQARNDWYAKNLADQTAKRQVRFDKNPGRENARIAEWHKAHPESRRISVLNRRARRISSGDGKLSRGLLERLFRLQKGKCACCSKPLGVKYHLDHIMPLALGGENIDANMQLLTQRCNNQKCAKHPVDFMRSRGFLI